MDRGRWWSLIRILLWRPVAAFRISSGVPKGFGGNDPKAAAGRANREFNDAGVDVCDVFDFKAHLVPTTGCMPDAAPRRGHNTPVELFSAGDATLSLTT